MKPLLICLLTLSCGLCALGQDSLNVTQVGSVLLPGSARGLVVQGNHAYVGRCFSGLFIVDVSSPSAPFIVGTYDTPGEVWDVAVKDTIAYLADWFGLRIVDVAHTDNPTELGYCDIPGWAVSVVAPPKSPYAYVIAEALGLYIVDVSDPTQPFIAGFCSTPSYFARDVRVSGIFAYVAVDRGLRVINVSNPASPCIVGNCDIAYWPDMCGGVALCGNYSYVADHFSGVHAIDISNPAQPSDVGNCDTPGEALQLSIAGSYLCVADASSGLRVLDISNPTVPVTAGFYGTPGSAWDVVARDTLAYVDEHYELAIYSFSGAVPPQDTPPNPGFVPFEFTLSAAYPNPFNSVTTLQLDLPREVKMRLAVYDVLGREVTVLKNGVMNAGSHRVNWNASDLSSGVYLVRLDAADFSQVQKVMLVK